MIGKIEYSSFRDLVVPYGGAFLVNRSIDFKVHSIQLLNLVSSDSTYLVDAKVGGSGFIFVGNNFYGSNICGFNLSTMFRSSIFVYSKQHNGFFNMSSLSCTRCNECNVVFGKGNIISNEVNITSSKTEHHTSTIHFGWYPTYYYQENFIGHNNTGKLIFGHSCSVTTEQICRNIVLVENEASNGILFFCNNNHRLINSYLLHNKGNLYYTDDSTTVLTLEDCYSEDTTGVIVTKGKTFYETKINVVSPVCDVLKQNDIYETCKKLINIRTYTSQRRISYSLFLFILLQTSQ